MDFPHRSVIGAALKSSRGKPCTSSTALWSADALSYAILIRDRRYSEEFHALRLLVSASEGCGPCELLLLPVESIVIELVAERPLMGCYERTFA